MRTDDDRSVEASAYRRLYKTARWQRTRASQLRDHPLCARCLAKGIVNDGSLTMDGARQTVARRRHLVVHHVVPHKGDEALFFGGPFETVCPDHHDIVIQQEERGRVFEEIDPRTGMPFGA